MITNAQGALVQRSLLKLCEKEGLLAVKSEKSEKELLQALLDLPEKRSSKGGYSERQEVQRTVLDEKFLQEEFRRLSSQEGRKNPRLSREQCLSWDWVAGQVGVTITQDAAEKLWARVVSSDFVDEAEFVAFARALQEESGVATTIQSFLRGCVGRHKAHSQAEEEDLTAQKTRCAVAMKLAPYNPTPSCASGLLQ